MSDYGDEVFEEEDTNKTLETLPTDQIAEQDALDHLVDTRTQENHQRVSFHEYEEKSMTHQLTSLNNRKKRASNDAQLLL